MGDLKTQLRVVLELLEGSSVTDRLSILMLRGIIARETNDPAFVAAREEMRAYLNRKEEVARRRAELVAVDSPA